jgi:cytochrome b
MLNGSDEARLERAATSVARVIGLARRVADLTRGVCWQKTANHQEPPSALALAALLRQVAADVLLVADGLERRQ